MRSMLEQGNVYRYGGDTITARVVETGAPALARVEKAAIDVGGGDRFDITQNRAIGRAYLSLLYRRYGNWPDAVSAYNWGLGRLDLWIRDGRPPEKLVPGVSRYTRRVLHDSGLCSGPPPTAECLDPMLATI